MFPPVIYVEVVVQGRTRVEGCRWDSEGKEEASLTDLSFFLSSSI